MLWRQGDVFIESIKFMPREAVRESHITLAEGEITGHSHRISDPDTAMLFVLRGELYMQVIADRAQIVHEEHGTIVLGRGSYRVWRQREYDPGLRSTSAAQTIQASVDSQARYVFD